MGRGGEHSFVGVLYCCFPLTSLPVVLYFIFVICFFHCATRFFFLSTHRVVLLLFCCFLFFVPPPMQLLLYVVILLLISRIVHTTACISQLFLFLWFAGRGAGI
jgi:hypothetical protein